MAISPGTPARAGSDEHAAAPGSKPHWEFGARLWRSYRFHHESNPSLLQWIGIVGVLAFSALYLVRLTGKLPPRWDDVQFRLPAIALCLLLAAGRWWPKRLSAFYLPYSYVTVFYCLAFFLPLTLLQNNGAANTVVNMMIGAVLITLLSDWRNTLFMLLGGYTASVAAYWLMNENPRLPVEFLYWWVPLCTVLVAGGSIAKYVEKRAELDRMRRLYAGLAGSIAHEMRNPLMQLRHVLDTMESALAAGDGPVAAPRGGDLAHVLRQGQDAVTRGLQGITLTLQQLKPKALEAASFRDMSAAHCVRRAVDEFAYDNPAQRGRVRVEEVQDFVLRVDETALMMVLFNLLKNALYYLPTHPGLVVTLVVDGSGAQPRILVHDSGPGMAADQLAGLFEEFSSSGKSEGTGLGLAFCRRAMHAFGGDIACESALGSFTRFTLRFPVVPQAQVEAGRDDMLQWARLALAGKQVLVVDDEAVMRRATSAKLAATGCEVEEAEGGAQALERLRHAPYDLVLLDVNMPGLDGFEVTRRIRQGAVPAHQEIPILGFTALPASMVRSRARQCGMTDFLNKGCDVLELARSMTKAMAASTAGPQAGGGVPPLAGRAILLADDNAFNRAIAKAQLNQLGADVIEAEHGRQVLRLLEAGLRPAAILMDLEMPGLDGLQAARALRALPAPLRSIPVIALTGHDLPERHEAARAAGMDGVLVKPVEAAALREALLRALGVPAPAAATARLEIPPGLLNTRRIDDFERMGLLQEMLPGCLGEIRRFIGQLEQSFAARDRSGAHQALHSLVGLSGEAGAQALHLAAKSCYGALAAGGWPAEPGWIGEIQRLATLTEKAVQDRYSLAWGPSVPGTLSP